MAVSFFDNKKQHSLLRSEIDAEIAKVIDSGRFILGENVQAFEKETASYCGVKYGVGLASGTDAIQIALQSCGIKAGDEVITSPFTFVATVEAICYLGAKPVFVDIDPKTFTIDTTKIKKKISRKTKAILPVHLYGQAAEMDAINELAKKHNLKVVEDAAQAIGAEYKGRKACSLGDAGCLSFFPTKNLGCFGDGGMLLTNDEDVATNAKVYRDHGRKATYHYDYIGYNSRLDALQAAILRVKLKHLEKWESARIKNAAIYDKELSTVMEATRPFVAKDTKHVYNQYTIRAKNRNSLQAHLKEKGIGAMVYYPLSLHLQKAYSYLKYKFNDMPESELAQEEALSLPIYPELEENKIVEVCKAINEFYLNF